MSEGKTNRIASLTAKSLKNLFGGDEEETCQHVGEGTPPQQATCGDTLTLGRDKDRTGRGAPGEGWCARRGQPREAKPPVLCPPSPSDASRPTLRGFLNRALNTKIPWCIERLQNDCLGKKWSQSVQTLLSHF